MTIHISLILFCMREDWLLTLSCIVGENIIATIKMRNNFCYPLKMVIFCDFFIFLYCSPFSYRSSNFEIAKVVALNLFAQNFCFVDWFMAAWFCITSHIVIALLTIATAIAVALKGVSVK